MPHSNKIRDPIDFGFCDTGAGLRVPLLEDLTSACDMGGEIRRKQVIRGFPALGGLAESGIYPVSSEVAAPISREQLSSAAKRWVEFLRRGPDSITPKLRNEARVRLAKGWLRGPFKHNSEGYPVFDGGLTAVGPAFCFGAQQSDKLRAVGD